MPPKDSEMNKAVYMAANGEEFEEIGVISESNMTFTAEEITEEYMAALTKSIKALTNAFREFTAVLKVSSKQQGRLLEVFLPQYKLTEWRFPKKKPRGTMRRKRREKRRLA